MGLAKRPITTKVQCSRSDQAGTKTSDEIGPSLSPQPDLRNNIRRRSSSVMPSPTHAPATLHKTWIRRSSSWTPEEDAKLFELIEKEASIPHSIAGYKIWSRAAAQLPNRNGKQCRERYFNELRPGIRRGSWSPEEEKTIRLEYAKFGNKWVLIASKLPGRTPNCVKSHWNAMLRKRKRSQNSLDAAQVEVTHELRGSQVTQKVSRRNGSHDVRSGVSSLGTASSSNNPLWDSLLQICNHIVSSKRNLPNWTSPYVGRKKRTGRFGKEHSRFSMDGHNGVVDLGSNMFNSVISGHHTYAPFSSLIKPPSPVNAVFGNGGVQRNASYLPDEFVASPMQCIESSQVPQFIQNGCFDGGEVKAVRRSSQSVPSSGGRQKTSEFGNNVAVRDMRKTPIDMESYMNRESNAAALVLLADVASSLPPSPLTPQSSTCNEKNRSRSISPVSRICMHGNCVDGSN